jgi:hypothetical protein
MDNAEESRVQKTFIERLAGLATAADGKRAYDQARPLPDTREENSLSY